MTTLQWVLLIWLGIGAALQGVLAVLGSETRDWESRLILLTLGPAIIVCIGVVFLISGHEGIADLTDRLQARLDEKRRRKGEP